jgi:murein L,D-transpeptidase YafK
VINVGQSAKRRLWASHFRSVALGLALAMGLSRPASAVEIEITGGGPDRLERQRAWADARLPLAGTPDLARLDARLSESGLKLGAPIFMRIFKEESVLEVWMQRGDRFKLFASYPICQWSGVLGPKELEGDNQSPEGFYAVTRRQLKWKTKHHRAFNIGFPNLFDRAHDRTGSEILVHGGCSTEGCFAMTNPVIDEIFKLSNAALTSGQTRFGVHIFPFRMTMANLARHGTSYWLPYWLNLKTGYDLFEATHVPPAIGTCGGSYVYTARNDANAIDSAPACAEDQIAARSEVVPASATAETINSDASKTEPVERPERRLSVPAPRPDTAPAAQSRRPAKETAPASATRRATASRPALPSSLRRRTDPPLTQGIQGTPWPMPSSG